MPSPSELNRNRFLENFSVGAFSIGATEGAGGFLARALMPVLPVEEDAGKFHELNMDDIMRDEMAERQPGDPIPSSDFKITEGTYLTKQYAYGQKLPEEVAAKSYGALDVEEAMLAIANERALISQEKRFGAAYWTTGVWGRDMVGAATDVANTSRVYWNRTAATPVDDLADESWLMKVAGWRRPNTLALGAVTAQKLMCNAQIIGRLNNGQTPGGPAEATLMDLAKLFKVQRVIVAEATYNSAKQGATASKGAILDPKSAWLGYVAPKATKYTLTAGVTVTYRKLAGNDQGVRVYRRWSDEVRSHIVEVIHDDAQKVVCPKLGTFFSAIVE